MQPFVSIVILNWNGESYIRQCIDSVLKQEYRNFDIILADNNSSDKSIRVIKRYFSAKIKSGKIKLIENSENLGVPEGNNVGIRKALSNRRTKYIALLNPDTKVDGKWLSHLVNAAENDKSIGAIQGKMLKFDKRTIDSTGVVIYNSLINSVDRGHGETDKRQYEESEELLAVCGAGALYRRKALEDIAYENDYMDSDFFCMWEDVDMAVRMFLSGWKLFYIPEAVMYHMRSVSTGTKNPFSAYYLHRNNLWFAIKCVPTNALIKRIPLIILFDLSALLFFSAYRKRLVKPFLKAKIDAFFGIPKMLRKRKFIMGKCSANCKRFGKFLDRRFVSTSFRR